MQETPDASQGPKGVRYRKPSIDKRQSLCVLGCACNETHRFSAATTEGGKLLPGAALSAAWTNPSEEEPDEPALLST